MKRIFITLLILLLYSISHVSAQTRDAGTSDTPPAHAHKDTPKQFVKPIFRGFSIHYDLASPIMGLIYGKVNNYEVQFDVNLYRRIYPIVELGFSSVNNTLSTGVGYSTNAPFFRIGLNYGLLRPFKNDGSARDVTSYPFIGLRYAFSPMNYNISNLEVFDQYWGTSETVSYSDNLVYSGWLEIVGGVRINLYKGLTMGWIVKFKTALHTSAPDKSYLWYVPGYGKSSASAFSFSYTIGYSIFTKEKKSANIKN